MAKPADDKNDKNTNEILKPQLPLELNTNNLIIINNFVVIIILIISMAVMYVLLNNSINQKISKLILQQETMEEEVDEDIKEEGILLDLGDFIVNLADAPRRSYLKAGVALELSKTDEEIKNKDKMQDPAAEAARNAAIAAEMERYKPAIRDAIISVLSNKTSDELSTPTGKEVAKEEILEMVNNIFEGQREVIRVSFGQFIIQ